MKHSFLLFAAMAALAGCQPQTKYDWGAYSNSLLAYYQSPADRPTFDKALDEAIKSGEAKHRVPPGLYAEAGYESLSRGDSQKAIALFNQEKATWPESAAFMDKSIANTNKGPQSTAQNQTAKGSVQ